jgi:hypothetical protein
MKRLLLALCRLGFHRFNGSVAPFVMTCSRCPDHIYVGY